ncbi:MAG TPA: hypothetical protein VLE21_06645 [Candidatus Nitrosocosmicus sp.]|nr:hypothetical protein [Candidatus Nitrosocosmicus sp.]
MEQIDEIYKASQQGNSGHLLNTSKEVFDYLGLKEGDHYYGRIFANYFILCPITSKVLDKGPGIKVKTYEVRKMVNGFSKVTLPKIWGDKVGIRTGAACVKYKDVFEGIPIIKIRLAS